MVWKRNKSHISVEDSYHDSTVVDRGYLVAQGSSAQFAFQHSSGFLPETIHFPIFQVLKVHRGHPVGITVRKPNYVRVWPADGARNKMPLEVMRDRKLYDVATFLLVQGDMPVLSEKEGIKYVIEHDTWQKVAGLEGTFQSEEGKKASTSSLIYLPHGIEIDEPRTIAIVPPSQVISHFYSWLTRVSRLEAFRKDQAGWESVGRIEIPYDQARSLCQRIAPMLENRYGSRLTFGRDFGKSSLAFFEG